MPDAQRNLAQSTEWPTFAKMTWLRLAEGPHDGIVIHIAPTMKSVIHKGERYNRVDQSRARGDEGMGAVYLWVGWLDAKLRAEGMGATARSAGNGEQPADTSTPEALDIPSAHVLLPSKDWMKQGAHALCSCGAARCSVLIERGELKPICQYCGFGYDPETMKHEVDGFDDHWPNEKSVTLILEASDE